MRGAFLIVVLISLLIVGLLVKRQLVPAGGSSAKTSVPIDTHVMQRTIEQQVQQSDTRFNEALDSNH